VTKHRLVILTVTGLAALGIAAGFVLVTGPFSHPSPGGTSLAPVSNVSESTRACLFTAPAGDPAAQPALQGLNEAARARKDILVQQFTVPAHVPPAAMFGELSALHCQTIVAVGSQAEAQVTAHARGSKGTRYLVIGSTRSEAPDVTFMSPKSATAASVESAVLQLAR
jgi:hypothetical protein